MGNYKSDLFLWLFFYLLNLGPGVKPRDDTTLLKLCGAGQDNKEILDRPGTVCQPRGERLADIITTSPSCEHGSQATPFGQRRGITLINFTIISPCVVRRGLKGIYD